jgi:Glycosyl transferase family 8
MSHPVVIYTNLFTVYGRDTKINRYIDMYYIWLFNIIKYGNLQSDDYVITFMDEETLKVMEQSGILNVLYKRLPHFYILKYKQPQDIKEGMLKRYEINSILELTGNQEESMYLYLDIDVMIVNDIRKLTLSQNTYLNSYNKSKTTIYLRGEENILGGNYVGDIIGEDDRKMIQANYSNLPGFTSGIFCWHKNQNIKEFFNKILEYAAQNTKELYTIDQPFFNLVVWNNLKNYDNNSFNLILLDNNVVGHNTIGGHYNSKFVLLNFCGIPGDYNFHWNKQFLQLLVENL